MKQFFIIGSLCFAMASHAVITYPPVRDLTGGADTLWLENIDSIPSSIYAAEVRCAMPAAASGRHSAASWRMEWPESGLCLELKFDFTGYIEGADIPAATLTAVTDGSAGSYGQESTVITSGMDFNGGANTMALEWRDGCATILCGKHKLSGVITMACAMPAGPCAVTASSKASVLDAAIEVTPSNIPQIVMSADSVRQYFSDPTASFSPIEGIWQYLDRDTDTSLAIPGGNYRLAIVAADNANFSIIYLDGAKTNRQQWIPGMRKGIVGDLGFSGHYSLRWTDAMFRSMGTECYLSQLSSDIISFNFPEFSASMRFRRVN